MKSKLKKIIILFIGLVIALSLNNTLIDNKGAQNELDIPKQSAGYLESFIHVDGNWTDTANDNDWCYGQGTWQEPYVIENVTIDASSSPTGNGIFINNSKSDYFIIRNCTIFNADNYFFDSGIWLENTNNGTIRNNNCSDNNQGIYLIDCEGNNITENTANDNKYNGIYLDTNCVHNNIMGNIADNNLFGIQLVWGCDNNNITLNTVTSNDDYGIFINSFGASCDNNIILNNTVNENNRYGIYVRYDNNENSIINNSVNDNIGSGIYLYNCHDINVTGNYIYSNTRGIYVFSCDNGIITGNTINNNLEVGIYLIANSDDNEIKNNTINRNDLGIKLDDSDYNNVTGNTLKDNNWCIYETYCEGNIIEFNDCSSPTVELPIYIDDYATGVDAHNWTWAESQPWCSGTGTSGDPYILENLKISGFGTETYGIDIRNSNVSFIIQESWIYHSDEAGIYLDNVNNSRIISNNCSDNDNGIYIKNCNNITIFENIANDNRVDGIFVYESNYVNITGNIVNNNDDGIYTNICNFSYIIDNIVNGNTGKGIYLEECFNNTLLRNDANNNYQGIVLWYCDYNAITGNTANLNGEAISIQDSHYNNITGNTINNNDNFGIYIYVALNNTIKGNIVSNNGISGIYIDEDCDYNEISENIIYNNTIGIHIDGLNDDNLVYKNFFLKNGIHAVDDGTDNKWNITTIGNYWDNHTGPDTAPQDGIVDIQYNISGSAGSIDYLPIAEDGAPSITINSPNPSDLFDTAAPSFNVRITDNYLDEMWYTIDGGLHNYTFTVNGTIDQTAWDALSDGTIILTFYASDIQGNIGYADVMITKGIPPAGDDPTIVIVIVVVSIVGGVAVLAGLYIFMKKRTATE